ncbi:hypothetical protein SUGI_0233750 [Cryptomeria japonica]|nr:hypothetical protein SUGI_0233750 [Cryptomeria japonica]
MVRLMLKGGGVPAMVVTPCVGLGFVCALPCVDFLWRRHLSLAGGFGRFYYWWPPWPWIAEPSLLDSMDLGVFVLPPVCVVGCYAVGGLSGALIFLPHGVRPNGPIAMHGLVVGLCGGDSFLPSLSALLLPAGANGPLWCLDNLWVLSIGSCKLCLQRLLLAASVFAFPCFGFLRSPCGCFWSGCLLGVLLAFCGGFSVIGSPFVGGLRRL